LEKTKGKREKTRRTKETAKARHAVTKNDHYGTIVETLSSHSGCDL